MISPPAKAPSRFAMVMRGITWCNTIPTRQRHPLGVGELYSLVDAALATSGGAAPSHDQWAIAACVLVGFFGAFRCGEIVVTPEGSDLCARRRHLRWARWRDGRDVLIIDQYRSKTRAETRYSTPIVIGSIPGAGPARCPVAALRHLLRHPDAPRAAPSTPLFVYANGTPLTAVEVNRFLKAETARRRWAGAAGITSHSVWRYSMATALRVAGVDRDVIDDFCRWGITHASQRRYARARVSEHGGLSEVAACTLKATATTATTLAGGRHL